MVCITRGREPSRQAEAAFLGLLARAEAHAVDDLQRARVEQLRGQVQWRSVTGREAPVLLLRAAKRLESLDARLARETYLHARRELLATGEKVRKREVDTYSQVTSQEEHIIRLARDGRGNREIAAELFISTRTVEWHFRKVFAKLGITSRRDLPNAVPP